MKKMSLIISAAAMTATLTACPGKPAPEVPQPSELSGPVSVLKIVQEGGDIQVEQAPWTLGAKKTELYVLSDKTVQDQAAPAPLATGEISAGGQLSLKLPAAVGTALLSSNLWKSDTDWSSMLDGECQGTKPAVSDAAAQVGLGVLMVKDQPEGFLLAGPQPVLRREGLKLSGSAQAGTVVYVDRATTVRATVNCTYPTASSKTGSQVAYNVNLNLKPGWNSVVASGQGQVQQQQDKQPVSGNLTLNLVSEALPHQWMMPVVSDGAAVPLSLPHPRH